MNIKIISTSNDTNFSNKDDFNLLSGMVAGICYMPHNFEDLKNEPQEKSLKRANMTMQNGHHSVFEHEYVSLYLEDIPKLFAMLLNNQRSYVTSEKSARYTKMKMTDLETEIYNKWQGIFEQLIKEKYGNEKYFTDMRIKKLAQENARYFISIYTPTSMLYTVSYRQLNYLCGWMIKLQSSENILMQKLKPFAKEFCEQVKELNLIDENLVDDCKNRDFNFFAKKEPKEYYGDVYCSTYTGSFASFAQAQRHRTLNYEIKLLHEQEYFIPKILKENETLKKEWLHDMEKVKDNIPQASLVEIIEKGTPENLILKMKERLCTCAQQEIMEQTKNLVDNYIDKTDDSYYKKLMQKYSHGARCTTNECTCKNPCQFKDGINLTREI